MAYQYETVKLDKGMYSEAGRSFTKVLEQLRPLGAVQGHAAGASGCVSAAAQAL